MVESEVHTELWPVKLFGLLLRSLAYFPLSPLEWDLLYTFLVCELLYRFLEWDENVLRLGLWLRTLLIDSIEGERIVLWESLPWSVSQWAVPGLLGTVRFWYCCIFCLISICRDSRLWKSLWNSKSSRSRDCTERNELAGVSLLLIISNWDRQEGLLWSGKWLWHTDMGRLKGKDALAPFPKKPSKSQWSITMNTTGIQI